MFANLLNNGHWYCLSVAATIALTTGIASEYGRLVGQLIHQTVSALP